MSFCSVYEGGAQACLCRALRELPRKISSQLRHELRAASIDLESALAALVPAVPREFDIREARSGFIRAIATLRSTESQRQLIELLDHELLEANEQKIQEEKRDRMAFNLLGIGKVLEAGELAPGLPGRVWAIEVTHISQLKERGLVSLTHIKVLGRMFSYAMQELQKALPHLPMRNEHELLELGIENRDSLCAFLRNHREDLNAELIGLFAAILGRDL
jgi:hypothetical protein